MDGTPGFATSLATVSEGLSKVVDYTVVAAPDIYSPGVPSSLFSKGSKRKWSFIDESSLVLGLGRSSSSCITISSGKEMEDESSIDLDLSINLNRGGNRISNPKMASAGTSNALEVRRPKVDLELSLSTGPAESDVTTVQGFSPYQNSSESPTLLTLAQVVDEGSTSSRWKTGFHVSTLPNIANSVPVDHIHCYGNPIPVTPKLPFSAAVTARSVAGTSGLVNQQQKRRASMKICLVEGCIKGARGASGLCIAHGGGKRCQRAGCQKGAEGKTVYCKAHGGGRRCQYLGCTKSAEGRTDYCIGHGGGRRCTHEGCPHAARGKTGFCIRHGGGKRCKIENCTKSAEGISGLCISHGGGRRCQYPGCSKGAQGSTMFCKAHGGGRRCTFLGCTKGAEGSTPFCKGHGGGERCQFEGCTKSEHGGTLFCVSHGGGKRCTIPECTKSARGCTNYCVRHGGGKRCKLERCTKSAQGRTGFCKAHGGGKSCTWGRLGSEFGSQGASPCDKFSTRKFSLCTKHGAQIEDEQIHKNVVMVSTAQNPHSCAFAQTKGIFASGRNLFDRIATMEWGTPPIGYGHELISMPIPRQVGNVCLNNFSLPEGRVHGGLLMGMLRGSTLFMTSNKNQEVGIQLETGKSYAPPHSWV
ncbi:loricrin-related [Abeliophyllum distichum]|uniref:Loricrin-related n=1 Tax=Abeliophyllum distichum TaxID=126358 RepID=A0ABD1UQS1_9LAMI